jgi:hypothetical protein
LGRRRDWEWPEICCNTCKNLSSQVPWDMDRGEAMKYLYYFCPVVKRKVEVEEIVNPKKMPCKGKNHIKIQRQCNAIVRWSGSPHLKKLQENGIFMRCRREAVHGTTVCAVHGVTPKKRVMEGTRMEVWQKRKNKLEYFENEIKEKIEAFKNDPDLEKLEFELGYLKSLLPRIEESNEIDTIDKFKLLQRTLDSIFKNMEARERIIEQRRYSLGVEKVQMLMKYVFEAVKKHVSDVNILKKIGREIQGIALKMKNIDEEGELMEDPNDLEEYAEEVKFLPNKTALEIEKSFEKAKKKVKKVKKS